MLCLQHNIHTSCDLQTTDSGKNISILMRKLSGWKSSESQGKFRGNASENSVRTLFYETVMFYVYKHYPFFPGLAALMGADIAPQTLVLSLVCGCFNSYYTVHFFAVLICFKQDAFCIDLNHLAPVFFLCLVS